MAAAEPEIRETMIVVDEVLAHLTDMERTIEKKDRLIAENQQAIVAKDQVIAAREQALEKAVQKLIAGGMSEPQGTELYPGLTLAWIALDRRVFR